MGDDGNICILIVVIVTWLPVHAKTHWAHTEKVWILLYTNYILIHPIKNNPVTGVTLQAYFLTTNLIFLIMGLFRLLNSSNFFSRNLAYFLTFWHKLCNICRIHSYVFLFISECLFVPSLINKSKKRFSLCIKIYI